MEVSMAIGQSLHPELVRDSSETMHENQETISRGYKYGLTGNILMQNIIFLSPISWQVNRRQFNLSECGRDGPAEVEDAHTMVSRT